MKIPFRENIQSRSPHLALTRMERKFARSRGWNLNTRHPSIRRSSEWFVTRPDGSSCGYLHGFHEIRRARTLANLT
jgi:hypothetical protein